MAAELVITVRWPKRNGEVKRFEFAAYEHPRFRTLLGVVGPTVLRMKGYRHPFINMDAPLELLPSKEFSAIDWDSESITKYETVFRAQIQEIILNIDTRLAKLKRGDPQREELLVMQEGLRVVLERK